MAQPGESDCKGKAVTAASSSDETNPEFKCPRCERAFLSGPALCAHQNAHRMVKEPTKMSPVLAAVLNNPPPPDNKPELIPPADPKPGSKPKRARMKSSNYPHGAMLYAHPEPMQVHFVEEEEVNSYDVNPNRKPAEGEDFLRQLEEKKPEYHPYEMVVPEENTLLQLFTMDLLGEWMPLSGFEDYDGHLGTSSEETISDPAISRNYPMEEGEAAGLQTGSRTTTGHLDLELKLGF